MSQHNAHSHQEQEWQNSHNNSSSVIPVLLCHHCKYMLPCTLVVKKTIYSYFSPFLPTKSCCIVINTSCYYIVAYKNSFTYVFCTFFIYFSLFGISILPCSLCCTFQSVFPYLIIYNILLIPFLTFVIYFYCVVSRLYAHLKLSFPAPCNRQSFNKNLKIQKYKNIKLIITQNK